MKKNKQGPRTKLDLAQRVPILFWMKEEEKLVRNRTDEENARAIEKKFDCKFTPAMVKNMRKGLGWEKRPTRAVPKHLRIHLDDWEQRLSSLEARIEALEDAATS